MADIARAEGVSITAVSYVVNGRGDAMRIPAQTQQRILARCKQMNYSRDYLAAAMASRRTQTIGVVFTNAVGDFMNEILWGIHEALREDDQEVLLCLSEDDLATEAEDIAMLEHRHVDGIIAFPVVGTPPSDNWQKILAKNEPPVVFVDSLPFGVEGTCVRIDDFAAGRAVAAKVAEEGLSEAVVVMPKREAPTLHERVAGFTLGAGQAGIRIIGSFSDPDDPALHELVARRERPAAFFSPIGTALLKPLRAVFYNGQIYEFHMMFTVGGVTEATFLRNRWWMLCQAARDMGRTAARILLSRIGGADGDKASTLLPSSWVCNHGTEHANGDARSARA